MPCLILRTRYSIIRMGTLFCFIFMHMLATDLIVSRYQMIMLNLNKRFVKTKESVLIFLIVKFSDKHYRQNVF